MPYADKAKQSAYQAKRLAQRRMAWLLCNGPCKQCGSWEKLEVDHIDPSTKVTHKVWSWREERRVEELGKCQALCSACHKKKTIEFKSKPIIHGSYTAYNRKGCRCDSCREHHRLHIQQWRAKQKMK